MFTTTNGHRKPSQCLPRLLPSFLALSTALGMACANADVHVAQDAMARKDFKAAYEEFSKDASSGNTIAMRYVGLMQMQGVGTTKNVQMGVQNIENCAVAKDTTCMSTMARLYERGDGVEKNYSLALDWARKVIAAGSIGDGGALFASIYATGSESNYIVNGKADDAKYEKLAARGLEQRVNQIEAIDALAAAAASGHVMARLQLASQLVELSGKGTASSILELVDNLNVPAEYGVARWKSMATFAAKYPQTKASPRLLLDTMNSALSLVVIQKVANCTERPTLRGISAGDVKNAVWLPLKPSKYATDFLVKGEWSERWTFDRCGTPIDIAVDFKADGMGGAYFSNRIATPS